MPTFLHFSLDALTFWPKYFFDKLILNNITVSSNNLLTRKNRMENWCKIFGFVKATRVLTSEWNKTHDCSFHYMLYVKYVNESIRNIFAQV